MTRNYLKPIVSIAALTLLSACPSLAQTSGARLGSGGGSAPSSSSFAPAIQSPASGGDEGQSASGVPASGGKFGFGRPSPSGYAFTPASSVGITWSGLLTLAKVQLQESQQSLERLSQKSSPFQKTALDLRVAKEQLQNDKTTVERLSRIVADEKLKTNLNKKLELRLVQVSLETALSEFEKVSGVKIALAEDAKTGKIREDLKAKSQAKISLDAFEVDGNEIIYALASKVDLKAVAEGGEEKRIVLKNWPSLDGQSLRESNTMRLQSVSPYPVFFKIQEPNIAFVTTSPSLPNYQVIEVRLNLVDKLLLKEGRQIPQEWIASLRTGAMPGAMPSSPEQSAVVRQADTDPAGAQPPSVEVSGEGSIPGIAPPKSDEPKGTSAPKLPAGARQDPLAPPPISEVKGSGILYAQSVGIPGSTIDPLAGGATGFYNQYQVPSLAGPPGFEPGVSAPNQAPYSFVSLGDRLVALAETGRNAQGQPGVWMTAYRFDGKTFKKVSATFHPFQATIFNSNGNAQDTNRNFYWNSQDRPTPGSSLRIPFPLQKREKPIEKPKNP